ncbi:hypothetical protein [Streptomyces phaeochromogenes]|nr:hypothetical protein [Streptomyces phaeochromogenes]WRZ34517.1 hypothetical protein OG931_45695 [Streptomyces phaeochromogenes]
MSEVVEHSVLADDDPEAFNTTENPDQPAHRRRHDHRRRHAERAVLKPLS